MTPSLSRKLPSLDADLSIDDLANIARPTHGQPRLSSVQPNDSGGLGDSNEPTMSSIGVSVFILRPIPEHTPSKLCLAQVGDTKFCTMTKDPICQKEAHNKSSSLHFEAKPGIYLLANKSGTHAFKEPRFDIGILGLRTLEYFMNLPGSKSELMDTLLALERELKTGDKGLAYREVQRLKEAKILQTPAKSSIPAALGMHEKYGVSERGEILDFTAPVSLGEDDVWPSFSAPEIFDGVLHRYAVEHTGYSSDNEAEQYSAWFDEAEHLGNQLLSGYASMNKRLLEVASSSDDNATDLSLRTTSLEHIVGVCPTEFASVAPSLWQAVQEVSKRSEDGFKNLYSLSDERFSMFKSLNQDMDKVYSFLGSLTQRFQKDIQDLSDKLVSVSSNPRTPPRTLPTFGGLLSGPPDVRRTNVLDGVSKSEFETLLAKFESLVGRVDTIQRSLTTDRVTVSILGKTFSSVTDVLALIDASPVPISHGGFMDCYNILKRIENMVENFSSSGGGNSSQEDAENIKYLKALEDVNLTQDEHIVEQTYAGKWTVPRLLASNSGKSRSAKSELGGASTYKAWHDKLNSKGLGPTITRGIDNNKSHWDSIIFEHYGDAIDFKHLATEILQLSTTFLSTMNTWVDTTHDTLVNGGQHSDDVWWIITKVIRSIFEDFLSVKRGLTKTAINGTNRSLRAAHYIWGTLLTYQAMSDMIEKGFKNHPVVVGAYSQWMVAHSGRKEAGDALSTAESAKAQISRLEEKIAQLTKSQGDLQKLAETAKRVADKALSK